VALREALKRPQSKIVDLTPKLNREKWERENRWTLSQEDLDAIARKRTGPGSSAPREPLLSLPQ
jgi:hypothetical protein